MTRKIEEEKINIETLKRRVERAEKRRQEGAEQTPAKQQNKSKKKSLFSRKMKTAYWFHENGDGDGGDRMSEIKHKDSQLRRLERSTRRLKDKYLRELSKETYLKHFLTKLLDVVEKQLKREETPTMTPSQVKAIGIEKLVEIIPQKNQVVVSERSESLSQLKNLILSIILRAK